MSTRLRLAASAAAVAVVAYVLPPAAGAAEKAPRIPIGQFQARRLTEPPTVDGNVAEGEWDEALMTSGCVTVFSHKLMEARTQFGMAFDDERFYFLAECTRGLREWRLKKSARENDDYNFGDASIEVWVSPPTPVPETYQNIINTFPAVMDVRNIPSRGYSAMGWTGRWTLGVIESETAYVIEASVPIADFGIDKIADGDVWRFLLCRTSPGSKPRAQGSWSITQGFGEIVQHPEVRLVDDGAVLQVRNTISLFTGKVDFPLAVVAPRAKPLKAVVAVRIQSGPVPADDDRVLRRTVEVPAGGRKELRITGDLAPRKAGVITITATADGGDEFFRQSLPFEVNGFVHKPPRRPENAPVPEPLGIQAQYGPENHVMLIRADAINLPAREKVASLEMKVISPDKGRTLLTAPLPPLRNWYTRALVPMGKVRPPQWNEAHYDYCVRFNKNLPAENKARKKKGLPPMEPRDLPEKEPMTVRVEVSAKDAGGQVLHTASKEVGLLRYRFYWTDNDAGETDKVIPPWTPVTWRGGKVGVWNREMAINALGLLDGLDNGGTEQLRRMRLVAVVDGKRVPLGVSGKPAVVRRVENAITFAGDGGGAGLRLSARTTVEFDGFTLSDLTIAPADPHAGAEVDKLFLEIVLPETEATHFCTTAGGWAAVHDKTPAYWSSRQTASGLLIGDFVPYIWLTNSDRAFLWFADNDKGWITDDDKSLPTQEVVRKDGTVTLRVHFIELPTNLREPTTVRYGYQAFPAKPLPAGWRTIVCSGRTPELLPRSRNTYFWHDGNWAVLWPYYCSPYPWSMDKSRETYSRWPRNTTHRPMVGSIAHSVGRYRDYRGNEFPGYVVDWGATPGDRTNANCTQGEGAVDFRVWHYRRWVREAGFRGLYIDENYLALDSNPLTGGAYVRPDGRTQRGYSYIGLRDYYKRMKAMFHRQNVPAPNLWMHISSGAAYHAWLGDIFFEGENVEPTNLHYDYMEVLPAARMRAIGSSKCAGGTMAMMCQSQRHATVHEPKHTHQFVGWVLAHDVMPEQVRFFELLAQHGRFHRADCRFHPYWKPDTPAKTHTPDCLVSAHTTEGRALLWIVNTSREDRTVEVRADLAGFGLGGAKVLAINAETGEDVALDGGRFAVDVLKRDFAAVLLVRPAGLDTAAGESLRATFDGPSATADEAVGSDVFQAARRAKGAPEGVFRVAGAKGAGLVGGVWIYPHLTLRDEAGRLTFDAKLPAKPSGSVLDAGRVRLMWRRGKEPRLLLTSDLNPVTGRDRRGAPVLGKDKAKVRNVELPAPGVGWHGFELAWRGEELTVAIDGKQAGKIGFAGFGIGRPLGKDLVHLPKFDFGARGGAEAIDEVRGYRNR